MLDTLIANDRLKASAEVFNELRKKDDGLTAYFKTRPNTFVEIKDNLIQNKVIEILEKYLRLVDTRKGRGGADPFVIAYAMTGKPHHTIVTEESKAGSLQKPTIPFICKAERIRCISLVQLITEQTQTP